MFSLLLVIFFSVAQAQYVNLIPNSLPEVTVESAVYNPDTAKLDLELSHLGGCAPQTYKLEPGKCYEGIVKACRLRVLAEREDLCQNKVTSKVSFSIFDYGFGGADFDHGILDFGSDSDGNNVQIELPGYEVDR